MDVSCFSPSPNVHNLYFFFAPLTPFSPPSHLSSLSKFCPVRREVLLHRRRSSAAHPGLRSPGKSRTGGLGCRRAHRSLLVVGASTCSQPLKVVIVAVAVVTLTLVSLPYLISWGWKWKNDFKHVCHLSSLLVLHPFKYIMDQVVEGWALISGQFVKETSKEKACHSVENFTEISDASKNLKASVQSHKFDSSRPGPLIKEASDSPSAVVFRNKNFLTDSEVAIPSVLHSVYVTPPLHRVVQLSGFQTEAHQQNAECYLTIYETKGNAEPFRVNESHKQLDEIEYSDNECHEEDKFMNFRSLFKDSPREDQSVKMSSATLNGPENFACGPSLLGSNNVTSIIRDMNRHGSDLSSKNFYHNADNLNGRVPLASLKRDPFGKRKLRRNRGFANDSVKSSMHQNSHQDLAQLPSINGMKSNSKQTIPEEYSTYRSLLHVGRINDSLELLEAMERVDLLDMNKVYHAKFFEKCKTKKAVKAAFRFTKLIPNPTLSAFNMLMSVCASSQDFEGAFQVLQLVREAGLKADCKLYTTLISTCAKSGKVDAMFEVFHEMVNTKVEPNLHTYGALIDGCARAGQVAKAFGAYGIMRSK